MTIVSLYALPILSIVNVYPLPSENITTIEYFQQIGTTNDITLLPVGTYFIKIGNYTEKFEVLR